MTDGDLHDQISRLEAQIDKLADTIEGCRKIILASKVAIAAGGIWVLATLLGAVRFDLVILSAAMTTFMGGIVVFGSNTATSQQASARMKDAEAVRAELIGRLELQLIDDKVVQQPS